MKGKKGVSPIIATVILMSIAIALGAIVMSSGKGYVEKLQKETEVAEVSISCATEVNVQVIKACFDDTKIKFIVSNKANKQVLNENAYVRITFEDTSVSLEPFALGNLHAGEIKSVYAYYFDNQVVRVPKIIELVPALKNGDKEMLCEKTSKEVKVTPCAT